MALVVPATLGDAVLTIAAVPAPVKVRVGMLGAGVTTMLRLGGEVESACGPADRAKLASARSLPTKVRLCRAAPSAMVRMPPVAVGAKLVPVTEAKAIPVRISVSLKEVA